MTGEDDWHPVQPAAAEDSQCPVFGDSFNAPARHVAVILAIAGKTKAATLNPASALTRLLLLVS